MLVYIQNVHKCCVLGGVSWLHYIQFVIRMCMWLTVTFTVSFQLLRLCFVFIWVSVLANVCSFLLKICFLFLKLFILWIASVVNRWLMCGRPWLLVHLVGKRHSQNKIDFLDLTRIPLSHRLYDGFNCSDPSSDKFPGVVRSSCGLGNFLLRASSACGVQSQEVDTAVWFKCLEILIEGVKFELINFLTLSPY